MNDADASSSIQERPSLTGASSRIPHKQSSSSLDDYEIIGEIGRGGTAIVYEAYHKSLRRKVALKQLPAAAALDPRWQERFQNEVHATSQLSHSNIVPFYELGSGGDSHFYTMQLIDGISLAEVIRRLRQCREGNRPCMNQEADVVHPAFLTLCDRCKCRFACHPVESNGKPTDLTASPEYCRAAVELVSDAALAVQHAHDQGILHLDIKPSNILIDGEGKMWVMDFGAARSNNGAKGSDSSSGTLCYMSAEQALGHAGQLDARSDVYSLGATLYELLTLERPFFHTSPHALLTQVSVGNSTAPHKLNGAIPSELAAIITKAMAREQVQRHATAGELADDLQACLVGCERQPQHATGVLKRAWPVGWLGAVGALACLTVASIAPFYPVHGPIAEWRFEEGIEDSAVSGRDSVLDTSGANLHVSPVGGPTYRSVSYGGLALEFDGVNDRLTLADDPKLQLTKGLTLEAVIRIDSLPGHYQSIVARMDDRGGFDPYQLRINPQGRLQFSFDTLQNRRISLKSPDPLPIGKFVHVAATLDDQTGDIQLFVDRKVVALNEGIEWRPLGKLDPLRRPSVGIGGWSYRSDELFNGIIDEVRIWDEACPISGSSTAVPITVHGLVAGFIAWTRRCK